MSRIVLRKTAYNLIKKYNTTDPFALCDLLGIKLYRFDLGTNIMGYRSKVNRISTIILNIRNSEREDDITCRHELGHHIYCHNINTEYLTRKNLRFVSQGNEFEANFFMVETLLYNANLACYPTKQSFLQACNVPKWAECYVDWEHLKATSDFNSYDSYY